MRRVTGACSAALGPRLGAALVALLAVSGFASARPAGADTIPVAYEECRFVFAGRDTFDQPVIASFFLATGTGPGGATIRKYRGWIGRGGKLDPILDATWSGAAPASGALEDVFPAGRGLVVRGESVKTGSFLRPTTFELAWSDELRAISLTTGRIAADFTRPLDEEPSDLYRSADPAGFRRVNGVGSGTLTLGLETIKGHVFLDFVASRGSSPFLEDAEAPGHFGDYDRAILWDDTGTFWLVETGARAGVQKTRAETVQSRKGRPAEKLSTAEATLSRLSMKPFAPARRQLPDAWRIEVPAWSFDASLRAQGEAADVGGAGARGQKTVSARFSVLGEAHVQGETRPVFGMMEHVQD